MSNLKGRRVLITMDTDIPAVPEGIETFNAIDFFLDESRFKGRRIVRLAL